MADSTPLYARVVQAIVEGTPIDWTASNPHDDPSVAELRVLHEIARVHRDATTLTADARRTVGAPPPASVGRWQSRWAHLYILDQIGEGSFGVVYRAWDSRLAREVALKLMSMSSAATSSALAEARRLARVRHPAVVSVYGADHFDGRVGIWMELVQGDTLHRIVQQHGAFSAREAAVIGADVCSALAAVHSTGLLHRDIKAHNVMREQGGRIVLMDLGAGREIGEEHSMVDLAGTPLYMAPELFAAAAATAQSDIYSVGVLLFFVTTGLLPVEAKTIAEVREAHARGTRRALRDVRANLPPGFVTIVERALSRDAARRFASAGEMERELSDAIK